VAWTDFFIQIPPKKTEEELKEEEELQLALALSKSEAEEKEKEVGRIPAFSFTVI
jgi:hepatocyte growth factor-regulated tyrosine kinase substrate